MAAADYEIIDDRFRRLVRTSAGIERLYNGCRWAEGPAYFPSHRTLIWSDVVNERMLRWDEATNSVGVFRPQSNYSNGNTVDRQGRLVTCEQGTRRVTRTEHDGSITVLADRYGGLRFNSPNDVVVHSDGSIWFTDPSYGIDSDYEGIKADREQDGCHVYRVDPDRGSLTRVASDLVQPNGLAFSLDETTLYIADTGASHVPGGPRHIRAYQVSSRGTLAGGEVFATCDVGMFDGFRLDDAGRIWSSTAAGVSCYEPNGELIGRIRIGEPVANLAFGGPKRNRLYICATTSLYSVLVAVNGAGPF